MNQERETIVSVGVLRERRPMLWFLESCPGRHDIFIYSTEYTDNDHYCGTRAHGMELVAVGEHTEQVPTCAYQELARRSGQYGPLFAGSLNAHVSSWQ
jgi:hypothetical protein